MFGGVQPLNVMSMEYQHKITNNTSPKEAGFFNLKEKINYGYSNGFI